MAAGHLRELEYEKTGHVVCVMWQQDLAPGPYQRCVVRWVRGMLHEWCEEKLLAQGPLLLENWPWVACTQGAPGAAPGVGVALWGCL